MAGRPSKKPKLIRHVTLLDTQKNGANTVQRHRVFSQQRSGTFALRTTYIPPSQAMTTSEPVQDPSEPPITRHDDPWNEVLWDVPTNQWDDPRAPSVSSKQRSKASTEEPLHLWLPERATFLDEFIRLEGRGKAEHWSSCRCGSPNPIYRCKDCFTMTFFCQDCVVQSHFIHPFHRVEQWTDNYFAKVTLKSLGLRIQLGHSPGEACPQRQAAFDDDFVIIDVHAIHPVALDWCGCEHATNRYRQLLSARLYPASVIDPRTAATFAVMELFHVLSFESKVTAYEFFHAIARRTDNTGSTPIRNRYAVFLRMVSQWRNLKALKRSGRGHDPAGIDATQEGDLAILCPACPHPEKNLPINWAQSEQSWLYATFVALDANFRLKRRHVSSDVKDPGLSNGWGYFVDDVKYKAYLSANSGVPQERSTCVSHNAVNMADTKSSKGLAATGVGAAVCARHDMKLPCGVGDLQKGERYVNMDYIFASALARSSLTTINVSYDIACQWHKKFWQRMKLLPSVLQIDPAIKNLNFFVPKFHLAAHIETCQTQFSLNWSPGVGRTDGEAPERGWANINQVASSTKEMGPGSRRDVLNDHFGDANWKKKITFGHTLLRRLTLAVKERMKHREALQELQMSIEATAEGKSALVEWTREIEDWETDKSKPNPLESKVTSVTLSSVRLQLAQQDASDLELGKTVSLHAEVTASVLLSMGLDLEHLQRRLQSDWKHLGHHPTEDQRSKLLLRSNALQREIDTWISIQALYLPGTSSLRASGQDSREKPENIPLLFPSDVCETITCDLKMLEIEWALRYAQAGDALDECRHLLRLRAQLLKFKDRNLRGQGANTRAQRSLQTIQDRLSLSHSKYHRAHSALTVLAPKLDKSEWRDTFQPLKVTDLRAMGDLLDGQTQGTAIMSWIWRTHGVPHEDAGLQDALRIEWTKARARSHRWNEEVHLLVEEMRRVLAFVKWEAELWDQRAVMRSFEKPEDTEAFAAYAKRQAAIRCKLSASFTADWVDVGKMVMLGPIATNGVIDTDAFDVPTIDAPPYEHPCAEDDEEQADG